MTLRSLLIFASLLAWTGTAHAYLVKGNVECQDVVKEDENESYRLANKFWLLGYLTARNFENQAEKGKNIEIDDLYEVALTYCKNNPAMDIDDAGIFLYDRLN